MIQFRLQADVPSLGLATIGREAAGGQHFVRHEHGSVPGVCWEGKEISNTLPRGPEP